MKRILVVDDSKLNRLMLVDILKKDYEIEEAESGLQALKILEKRAEDFSLVILDIIMPEVSGYDVLCEMDANNLLEILPVIVISGDSSSEVEKNSLVLKATDFIKKPFDDFIVKRRVKNVVDLYSYKNTLEEKIEEQTKKLNEQYDKIRVQNERIIDVLGMVVEYRDLESGNHIQRIKTYTKILALELMNLYPEYKLTKSLINTIVQASVLHDVGKIAIPDNILLKPGRLTNEEFEIMKTHTIKGAEIIEKTGEALDSDFEKISYDIAKYHHERYDGRGYPLGLKGDEIPLPAQIVSIADVYDALVTERVYKRAYTHVEAFNMILNNECGVFSPKLLECFKIVANQFEKIAERFRG